MQVADIRALEQPVDDLVDIAVHYVLFHQQPATGSESLDRQRSTADVDRESGVLRVTQARVFMDEHGSRQGLGLEPREWIECEEDAAILPDGECAQAEPAWPVTAGDLGVRR